MIKPIKKIAWKISKTFSLFVLITVVLCTRVFSNQKNQIVFDILCYAVTDSKTLITLPESSDSLKSIKFTFDRFYYDWENFEFKSKLDDYMEFFSENATEFKISQKMEFIKSYAFIYLPETDSGRNLDTIILEYLADIEEERLGTQLEDLENQNNQNNDVLFGENKKETTFVDKDSKLSLMEVNDEIFISQEKDDNIIKISSNKDETIREIYDSSFRLNKKEIWKISTVENSQILSTEEYFYKDEGIRPVKKIITTDKNIEVFNYTENGLCNSYKKYMIVSIQKKNDKSENPVEKKSNIIIEKQNIKFDDQNRVLMDVKTSYTYDESLYKKASDVFEQKYVYSYNDNWENIPPDSEYYEDKVLKVQTKYTKTPGKYVTQTYFDNNFTVKTYFQNSIKIKEVYTMNGEVWRVKDYEEK